MATSTAGVYWVHRTSAAGDGVTDDSTPIQALIDAANTAGGGIVYLQPNTPYACNLTLKANVQLVGAGSIGAAGTQRSTRLVQYADGPVIDTPGSSAQGMAVKGIAIKGNGSGGSGAGIRVRTGASRMQVEECAIDNFADSAIQVDSGAVACSFDKIYAADCLLNTTRAAKTGVIDLDGTDHYLHRCEVTSSQASLSDSNAYICAFVIHSANSMFEACIGEISDVGFYLGTGAFFNRFANCRADLNWGNGWEVYGNSNDFSSCDGTRNSQQTDNTYAGWYFAATSGHSNTCSSCRGASLSGDSKKQKYGFEIHYTTTAARYNQFLACQGLNNGTALFNMNPYPTTDPGVVGLLYSNSGVITVSV